MSVNLDQIVNSNTFGVWKNRTNEIITALESVVSLGGQSTDNANNDLWINGSATFTGNVLVDVIEPYNKVGGANKVTIDSEAIVNGELGIKNGGSGETTLQFYDDSSESWRIETANNHGELNISSPDGASVLRIEVSTGNVALLSGQISDISNHDTDDLAEGSNQYFTQTRARGSFSGGDGINLAANGQISVVQSEILPAGSLMQFAGTNAPTGWLICDGSAISRSTYANLFAVIGTTYGAGNGSTTFNLPDMRGRTPIGVGQGSGLTDRSLGDSDGEETHILTSSEMPAHNHTFSTTTDSGGSHSHTGTTDEHAGHKHPADYGDSAGTPLYTYTYGVYDSSTNNWGAVGGRDQINVIPYTGIAGDHSHTLTTSTHNGHTHEVSGTTNNRGGGTAHNNMQPFLALNFIIKV